jgi:hypothetical protein
MEHLTPSKRRSKIKLTKRRSTRLPFTYFFSFRLPFTQFFSFHYSIQKPCTSSRYLYLLDYVWNAYTFKAPIHKLNLQGFRLHTSSLSVTLFKNDPPSYRYLYLLDYDWNALTYKTPPHN